jgi:hypothetical protein
MVAFLQWTELNGIHGFAHEGQHRFAYLADQQQKIGFST